MIAAPVRAVMGTTVPVTFTPVDYSGEPSSVDPGIVTVGVVRADGTPVVPPATATVAAGVTRTYTLTAANTALLDQLTVTWTSGGVTVGTTVVDIVGNVFVTVAEIRGLERLSDAVATPVADMQRARGEVETMIERATGDVLSFVPRFATATMYHRGQRLLRLPHYFLRRVRWARYYDDSSAPTEVAGLTLTGVQPNEAGLAVMYDTVETWPVGRIVIGYEHGMDAPPPDVKRAAAAAVRRQVNLARSAVDSRAMSFQGPNGEIQRFPTPGLGPWITGVPEVDEVLDWYKTRYPTALVG